MGDNRQKIVATGIHQNVTRTVRMLMALRGIDQRDLAKAIELDPTSVSRNFSGYRKWALEEVERLGKVLDCDPGFFFRPADELLAVPAGWVNNKYVSHLALVA